MTNIDALKKAIQQKKPVSFEYNKPGKVKGERIGNPYALFEFTSKAGERSIKAHIVQTAGVSDSKDEKPFPDFRMFNIEELGSVSILESEPSFDPSHEKYNPDWEGYKNALARV